MVLANHCYARHRAIEAVTLCALLVSTAHAAPSQEKPAASMNDLRDHFSACFQPPPEAASSRVTFYFSLNTRGQVLGPPRTTWIGFKGAEEEKTRRIADFKTGFAKCLPLSMDETLAASIPGKVYFLQYIVADTGRTSQVLLRPFGSHYYDPGEPLQLEPTPLFRQRVAPVILPGPGRLRPVIRPLFPRFPIFVRRTPAGPRILLRPGAPPPRLR